MISQIRIPSPAFLFLPTSALLLIASFVTGCFAPLDLGNKSEQKSEQKNSPTKSPANEANERQGHPTPANNPQPGDPQQKQAARRRPPQTKPQPQTPVRRPSAKRPNPSVNQPRKQIHLSAGAALPQSLPIGTTMSFSAEYRFVGGRPKANVQYVWVIQGGGGKKTQRVPLRGLKSRGQLPAFFSLDRRKQPYFRPGDKPFRCYIEEWPASSGRRQPGDGKRVSNVIPLS